MICVGNLVVGGSGKTPVALALTERLRNAGINAHVLSHGYRGRLAGPERVDPQRHSVGDVGDEALLAARTAPTWVARDRVAGGMAVAAAGGQCVILDDGFQDPALAKDLALLVFDGGFGLGNGRTLPAGPLRESSDDGFRRAHAAVLVDKDTADVRRALPPALPCIRASMRPGPELRTLNGRRVFAFAGIGRPEKFFGTLRRLGCRCRGCSAVSRPSRVQRARARAPAGAGDGCGGCPRDYHERWGTPASGVSIAGRDRRCAPAVQ